jgi:copper(I)-binding protein
MRRELNALILSFLIGALGVSGVAGCDGGRPQLSIENARAELSPVLRGEALIYLRIVNTGGKDTLSRVTIDIPGAVADLHEMKGAFMVLGKSLRIPIRSTVELVPMGSHIMVEHLPKDAKEGYHFNLTLSFERSGEVRIPLVFQKAQPMMPEYRHPEEQ